MDFTNSEKKYHTYNNYLKHKFGQKVFKVPLDGGFTCPNKDGTSGLGGCIFCTPSGSGDFAGDKTLNLKTQFEQVKARLHEKWPEANYIAYFQANTNTHKPLDDLKTLFEEALSLDPNIVGLNIATRCDSLDDDKIAYLGELSKRTFLQVELGLQSVHEASAQWMNRCHDLACFDLAVKKLRQHQIEVIVHIINGIPLEDKTMMLKTINHINTLDIQGIKIHMLHVMKKTTLGHLYQKEPFDLLTLEDYVDIVVSQLEHLDPSIIVHRITGDAPKDLLLGPTWTLKKFVVMNEIDKKMRALNTYQGRLYKKEILV
jgi:radical SAM protein (TIGR01212 family)